MNDLSRRGWLAGTATCLIAGGAAPMIRTTRKTPMPIHQFAGHRDAPVFSLGFSPDGRLLASGGGDRSALIWDIPDRRLVKRIDHPSAVYGACFTAKGDLLVTGCYDAVVRSWKVGPFERVEAFPKEPKSRGLNKLVVSPRDGRIFSAEPGFFAPIARDLGGGTATPLHFPGDLWPKPLVEGLSISVDGSRLAAAHLSGVVTVWDAQSLALVGKLSIAGAGFISVAHDPGGKTFAAGSSALVGAATTTGIDIWDAQTLRHVRRINGLRDSPYSLTYSADGRHLLYYGSSEDVPLNQLVVWSVATAEVVSRTEHVYHGCQTSAVSPDGRLLATGTNTGQILLWDLAEILKDG